MPQPRRVAVRQRALLLLGVLAVVAVPTLVETSAAATRPTSKPASTPASVPVFRSYHGPKGSGADASGEPSLGVNPATGNVLFMANTATFRVHGFDPTKDDAATWDDVTDPLVGLQSADPILWTDPVTHRTFANQLELQGGSLQAWTDDDGATWHDSTMGSGIGIAFDHQSVVTGPPAPEGGLYPKPSGYPNDVYYCTNDLYGADCAISIDGGNNFLASIPVYESDLVGGPCSPIFGHLKTDPRDGTVYLPPEDCKGHAGVFASRDNTYSWSSSTVPGSTIGDSGHPSVGVGRKDGAVYYAWGSNDSGGGTGRVQVAVSFDHAKTWQHLSTLGKDLGIRTTRFPVVVAGDAGRAAVAFLGATATGDPGDSSYKGVWDLYVSYTLDGGSTWKTYDATAGNPVQRGGICTAGTTCLSDRSLLDFNDMVLDADGRVAIAFADGALVASDNADSGLAVGTILRQYGGPSLYAR